MPRGEIPLGGPHQHNSSSYQMTPRVHPNPPRSLFTRNHTPFVYAASLPRSDNLFAQPLFTTSQQQLFTNHSLPCVSLSTQQPNTHCGGTPSSVFLTAQEFRILNFLGFQPT
ncbi:hypothetical protein Sjap_003398 [Stephania japonica]|uniref:Uncharacterized protein n=1 Tax=Stephania japonica TaxID=461633 RepID=A0AAP0PTI2_9MAGN